jgi:hypothetical protein
MAENESIDENEHALEWATRFEGGSTRRRASLRAASTTACTSAFRPNPLTNAPCRTSWWRRW